MTYAVANSNGFVANASADVRANFIRRVYGLFFSSILATVLIGAYCAQPSIAPALMGSMTLLWILALVIVIALSFTRQIAGLNLALMYAFAAIQGAIFGPLLSAVNSVAPGVPAEAAILTVSVFGCLSLYALGSRRDFSFMGGFLFMALIALIVAGIVMMFVHVAILSAVYSVIGVLIFSGYVLYDTSNIMRRLGPNDVVTGAVNLYLDFLNMFTFILRLLMQFQGRD